MFEAWVVLALGGVFILGRKVCAMEIAALQERMWGIRFASQTFEPGFVWGGLMFLFSGLVTLLLQL